MQNYYFDNGGDFVTGSGTVSIDGGINLLTVNSNTSAVSIDGDLHVTKFSGDTIAALKNALDYGDVVVKCGHCGQWGAVKTKCRECGAPIDPI